MQLKKCGRCKTQKTLNMFSPRKTTLDGLSHTCKTCRQVESSIYFKTEKGMMTKLYSSQILSSKTRKHSPPGYTKQELSTWLYDNGFKDLYDKWVKSNYDKKLIPSIDRINDYKPYTFQNIQLMTWQENKQKGHDDRRNGINNKNSKLTIQYDLQNNIINTFYSQHEAARQTGYNQASINNCCKNKLKTYKGFIWKTI